MAGLWAFVASIHAQSALGIDTQEQRRAQDRERALRQQQEQTPDVRLQGNAAAETTRLPATETPCFAIQTVLLGRLRAVRFASNGEVRTTARNAVPAAPGDILNLRDVEQALENFQRVPTAEADIQIEPGELPGQSDLVVSYKQAFPLRLSLSADDSGSKGTGKYHGSTTLSYSPASVPPGADGTSNLRAGLK